MRVSSSSTTKLVPSGVNRVGSGSPRFYLPLDQQLPQASFAQYVLLAKDTQEMLLRENFRRPTRTDIAVSKLTSMPDLATLKVFPLDLQVATDEYEQLIALWNLALGKAKGG